jgi:hypothetical protein
MRLSSGKSGRESAGPGRIACVGWDGVNLTGEATRQSIAKK